MGESLEAEREMWEAAASVELGRPVAAPAGYRELVARYAGECDGCGAQVEQGATVFYNKRAPYRLLCVPCGGKLAAGGELDRVATVQPTTRERREARAERLRGWSDSNAARSAGRLEGARAIADGIPFGQPILVGHHSEGRHRRDVARMERNMRAGIDLGGKAAEQARRAATIEAQARQAIYSDDVDAVERLAAKIGALEAQRETIKADNAAFRKAHAAEFKGLSGYGRDQAMPHRGYELTNLSGNLSKQRARLEWLRRQKGE